MSARTKFGGIAILLTVSAFAYLSLKKGASVARPEIIFINQTPNSSFDTALKMSLYIAKKRSGVENALVLLDQLPPHTTVEDQANRFFEKWKIGEKTSGKGILFLYSRRENVFRIHVSYNLEGVLPDVLCRRLENAAKTYMLSEIPQDFLSELIITTNLVTAGEREENALSAPPKTFYSSGAGFSAQGYNGTLEEITTEFPNLDPAQKKLWSPSNSIAQTLSLYFKSLDDGLSEPALPLLTNGSQIFRMLVPRSQAQLQRIKRFYDRAGTYEVFSNSRWALVAFKPGTPNLPVILLKGSDGLWRVDEAKAWTYFHRFEDSLDLWAKYEDVPFFTELKSKRFVVGAIYKNRLKTPPPRPLHILKKPGLDEVVLGEIYLFELNWIRKAIEMFEQASIKNPTRVDLLWRLYDLYINHSEIEPALATLGKIAELDASDSTAKEWLNHYDKIYNEVKEKSRWHDSDSGF